MTPTLTARIFGAATAAVGTAMLVAPGRLAGLVSHGASTPSPAIVRVLGGRQLLQGAAIAAGPDRRWLLAGGSVVDVLHASSMVAAAKFWPRYRHPALASAAVAGSCAVIGALICRRPRP